MSGLLVLLGTRCNRQGAKLLPPTSGDIELADLQLVPLTSEPLALISGVRLVFSASIFAV